MDGIDVARQFQLASGAGREVCPIGDCVKQRGHAGGCGNADDFKRAMRTLTNRSDHEEEKSP